jgi:hypothetical protein
MALPLLFLEVRVAAIEAEDFPNMRGNSPNAEIKNGSRLQFVLKAAPKAGSPQAWLASFSPSPFRSREQQGFSP